jgi:hypothetical protein
MEHLTCDRVGVATRIVEQTFMTSHTVKRPIRQAHAEEGDRGSLGAWESQYLNHLDCSVNIWGTDN